MNIRRNGNKHFSLIVGPVGFLNAFQAKLFEKLALLGIGQAVKVRTHAGAANPVKDRLGTIHHVLVLGFPDIDAAGMFAQHIVIKSGWMHSQRIGHSHHRLGPARIAAQRLLLCMTEWAGE